MDVIGFGSLNLDEFWEVPPKLLEANALKLGNEYVRDVNWFRDFYPILLELGILRGVDPGGSAANTIAALKRMGFSTGFVGAAGKEDASQLRLEELGPASNLRILLTGIPSGRCLALLCREDPHKDRVLLILPNANDLAGSQGINAEFIAQFHWIHMTSFVSKLPFQAQIELVKNLQRNIRLSFDPGPIYCRMGLEVLKPVLEATDILFITGDELEALSTQDDTLARVNRLLKLGISIIVLKKGSEGIEVFADGRHIRTAPPVPERIVDRTGAGDVAAAGFIGGLLLGADLELCAELAVVAASKSVQGYGRSAYPDATIIGEVVPGARHDVKTAPE